jgi:hypothetical protein
VRKAALLVDPAFKIVRPDPQTCAAGANPDDRDLTAGQRIGIG